MARRGAQKGPAKTSIKNAIRKAAAAGKAPAAGKKTKQVRFNLDGEPSGKSGVSKKGQNDDTSDCDSTLAEADFSKTPEIDYGQSWYGQDLDAARKGLGMDEKLTGVLQDATGHVVAARSRRAISVLAPSRLLVSMPAEKPPEAARHQGGPQV